jgi:intracellular sulfur oxidation DsrE/DsrF family protein
LTAISSPLNSYAQVKEKMSQGREKMPAAKPTSEADMWFNKVKGTHRVVYDATRPHEIMPFAWPKVFLLTNQATGSMPSDCGVVVVMRHDAICYAFQDSIWEKYKFGELFKASELGPAFQAADAATATQKRNPFYKTSPGDFKIPGFGPVAIGIPDLMKDGVMFCVCNAAMTVYSNVVAMQTGMKADDVMADWKANLIQGVQIVPSGVWALGRAQEHKCAYIFAG